MPRCQVCATTVEAPNRSCDRCRDNMNAPAPVWNCIDCGKRVSTARTRRCNPCAGRHTAEVKNGKPAAKHTAHDGPLPGSVLTARLDAANTADEKRIETRRRRNREATAAVDLEAVRRDLLLVNRPSMLVDLAELASRSRSSFVLKRWPG